MRLGFWRWFVAVVAFSAQLGTAGAKASAAEPLVYVGTYTGGRGGSEGIYLFKMQNEDAQDADGMTLAPLGRAAATPSPSFLTIDDKRDLLFAVNEVSRFEGEEAGGVSSFRIDRATGKLTLLSQKSSKGGGPCHLVLDRAGRHVLVANYGGGSVAVLPIHADGTLGEASDFVQHAGHSVNRERQERAHAHCVTLDPTGKLVLICDLGLDQVLMYDYDAERGKLAPHDPPFVAVKPGAGPRHLAFHPSGRLAYVINELDSTVTVFSFDAAAGKLTEVQTITTLPAHFDGSSTTAEIAVHPSGRFLYASNRGADSIVLFKIDPRSGLLEHVADQPTAGRTPRHFGIDPLGEQMVIANQNSNTLLVCRIDPDDGRLKTSPTLVEAPTPVCVVFGPATDGAQAP